MKNKLHKSSFLLGVLTTLLLVCLVMPAMAAAMKTIEVFTGVKIYIDDKQLNPTDPNGNPVDVFIYDGTTYLPVRAVSEAVGKAVLWDGATQSVYLGRHSSSEPAVWLSDLDYFSGTSEREFTTVVSQLDNTGTLHYHCITKSFERTYKLNSQYSRMTGSMYQSYDERSYTINAGMGVEIYGDGKLLYVNQLPEDTTGFEPTEFDVDLTGVLELRVVFKTSRVMNAWASVLALGDVGLWP